MGSGEEAWAAHSEDRALDLSLCFKNNGKVRSGGTGHDQTCRSDLQIGQPLNGDWRTWIYIFEAVSDPRHITFTASGFSVPGSPVLFQHHF